MSELKPLTLYGHATGPNPWKVAIVLEELEIPYTTKYMDMADLKKDPYEKICVNGRVPAIEDPNTGITLWESGAIIEYLVDTYDKAGKLTHTTLPEKYHIKQWLYFQVSGQGPYYGQAVWFSKFHPEKVESAIQRYLDQIKRVLYVLNKALEGKEYLVGNKCTYADLAFLTWDASIPWLFADKPGQLDIEKEFPNYYAWNKRLSERPAVKKVFADKQAAVSNSHH